MLTRRLELPNKSFLLFGPRGTGKSTLVRSRLKGILEIDLLKSKNLLPLIQNPNLLADLTGHLKTGDWVFIDEIQKIPALLDEVHALYEEKKLNFALTGSSARKLRRGGANLLAGRALQTFLFPLTFDEFKQVRSIDDALEWGTLPSVVIDPKNRNETLATYVETYLRQELLEEGLIRKIAPFVRFLQIAGLYHAQILNIENIAREAQVGRTTVDKYFQILEDTLIGYRLPAFVEGSKAKEVSHPKFYLFDSGVSRSCAGLLDDPVDSVWKGFSFESFILNELRAYNQYAHRNRELYHYAITGSYDIDFVVETRKKTHSVRRETIAISVKNTKKWDSRSNKSLVEFQASSKTHVRHLFGIYRGNQILTQSGVSILPAEEFLSRLAAGSIF
ncbi:MAG: ATP-binding protein [Deltaproteobacteria bacterium]|nr:ATP-binding protein [Deltaproteobacteria bacterium]